MRWAFRRSSGSLEFAARDSFLGDGPLQVALLPLGQGGVARLHPLGEPPGELVPGGHGLDLDRPEVEPTGRQRDLRLHRGEPLDPDATFPLEVRQLLPGEFAGLARRRGQPRLPFGPPGGQAGDRLEDLVSLDPEDRDLGGEAPRTLGPERFELRGLLFQFVPRRVDRLLHLAELPLGRLRVGLLGLEDLGQQDIGGVARLFEQGVGLLQLGLELRRLALGRLRRMLGRVAVAVDLLPFLEQAEA